MGRILAYVLTAVLTSCFIFQLTPKSGTTFPRSWALISLLAIGILWAVVLWKGMPVVLKVPLLLVFALALVCVPIISGVGPAWADRPRREAVITLGGGDTPGSIAIVYHPGGTGATRKVVRRLGETLAARGHAISIFTANPGLSLEPGKHRAIILGSPVYFGEVRPPVREFVSRHAFSSPVFAFLTGSVPGKEPDLERVSQLVARAGGSFRAGAKVISGTADKEIEAEIDSLADAVERSLEGN